MGGKDRSGWCSTVRELLIFFTICMGGLSCEWIKSIWAKKSDESPTVYFYEYKNKAGRSVFVNDFSKVPNSMRNSVRKIEVSQISLNQSLARSLEKEADKNIRKTNQHQQRDPCNNQGSEGAATQESDGPHARLWLRRMWRDYSYLVVIAGLMVALLIATPLIIRRIEAQRWMRIMMILVPALFAIGALGYAGTRTTQAFREMRAAKKGGSHSGPCKPKMGGAIADEIRSTLENQQKMRDKRLDELQ